MSKGNIQAPRGRLSFGSQSYSENSRGTLFGVCEDVGMQNVGGAIRIAFLNNAGYVDFVRTEIFGLAEVELQLPYISFKEGMGESHRQTKGYD